MNKLTFSVLSLMLVALFAGSASAQAARPTTPAAGGPVPDSKIAVINTGMFFDTKSGIVKLNAALDQVDREFKAKDTELQGINQDIIRRTDEVQKQAALLSQPNPPVNEADVRAKAETIEQMKKDLKRKVEDAQAAYTRRKLEVQKPIFEDILKSLDAFAKQRGITMTLDAAKMPETILTISETIDITDAFIKDYNGHNPATASIAKPQ